MITPSPPAGVALLHAQHAVRVKLASRFLATATIRCRNNCELVAAKAVGKHKFRNPENYGKPNATEPVHN
jgi:hypothetical protein